METFASLRLHESFVKVADFDMISPQGRDLLIWMVVFTVVNLVVLGLRFYTLAYVKKRSLRVDDFLIVLSVASMLAMEGTTFWGEFNTQNRKI